LFFTVSDQRFAVPFRLATEISPPHNILPLINVAPHVLGVINFKGKVLPVLDILKIAVPGHKTRFEPGNILIMHKNGIEIGILIDGIPKIDSVDLSDFVPLSGLKESPFSGLMVQEIKYEDVLYGVLDTDAVIKSKAAK